MSGKWNTLPTSPPWQREVSVRPLLWWASFHLTSVTERVRDAIAPMGWFSSQTIQTVQGPCAKQINCAAISLGLESHEQQLRMRFNPVAFERLLYCIHLSSFRFSTVLYPKLMVTFWFHLYLSLIAFLASLKKKKIYIYIYIYIYTWISFLYNLIFELIQ